MIFVLPFSFFSKNKNNLRINMEPNKKQSPHLNNHEINLKTLERREMVSIIISNL